MSENLVTVKGQVSPAEREALERLAAQETRSVSQMVRVAVKRLLEATGAGREAA